MNGAGSGLESLWPVITVLGPILLAVVLFWAMWRNKSRTPAEKERTEQATRELYEESDRVSKARDASN
jgi:hypothetical protein